MRAIILTAALMFVPASALALQAPPGQSGIPGGEPSLLKSQEPDLSTDPAAIDELRHKMNKDKPGKRSKAKGDAARPAQPSEIVAGKAVHDLAGQQLALIEKVEPDSVVLRTGASLIKVPLEGFGVNKKGLLLNLTKPQFDALVASVSPTPRS